MHRFQSRAYHGPFLYAFTVLYLDFHTFYFQWPPDLVMLSFDGSNQSSTT